MQNDEKDKKSKDAAGVSAIAARCLEDAAFARQILVGDDYPAVRSAIIADRWSNLRHSSLKGLLTR